MLEMQCSIENFVIMCYLIVSPAYKCACAPGYTLVDNGRCASSASAAPALLLAHAAAVLRMDLHGRAPTHLANATAAAGLDFHYRRNLLFWSDLKTRKVRFMKTLFYIKIMHLTITYLLPNN